MGKEQNLNICHPSLFTQTRLLIRGRDVHRKQTFLSDKAIGCSLPHIVWKKNEAYSVSKWIVAELK